MLNELDKEMDKRGLNFVRYADDCIIMVGSEMSANRVMRNISRFIEEKLGLKVNMIKSKVDKPQGLKYLGFGFYFDSKAHQYKAKPHAKSVAKFKKRMKELTCRSWGVSNSYKVEKLNQLIRGWINYFKIGSMKTLCKELDSRIRYRLRMCIRIFRNLKTSRRKTLHINAHYIADIDFESKKINYSNASHAPLLLIKDKQIIEYSKGGTIVGLFKNAFYEEDIIELNNGDIFLFFTDGIIEASQSKNKYDIYGINKLKKIISTNKNLDADALMTIIKNDFYEYLSYRSPDDDCSMFLFKVK